MCYASLIKSESGVEVMNFSEQLLALRRMKGLSQEELAEQVGVSRQAVSKWENGETAPDLQKLLALSETLEVSLDYLCGKVSSYGECSTVAEERHERRRSPWRTVGLLVLSMLAVFGLLQLICIIAAPEVKALPTEVKVSGVHFSSSDGETLHYALIPGVSSDGYSYSLLFTPDNTTVEPKSVEIQLDGGAVAGEAKIPLKTAVYWTVTLQISNGCDVRSVPVATYLQYEDSVVEWTQTE